MALKTIGTNFLVAQASALVLHAAKSNEALVKGLQGLTLPLGFEMSTIQVSEMGRRIDLIVPSGGAYTAIDITANFVPGDPTQQFFQDCAINSTKITDMRFYLKQGCDFAALDLINDSGGAYMIGTYSPPSVGSKNELYQNSISILPAGSSILFIAHTGNGLGANLSFASVADGATATLSSGSFVTMGFEVGDVCILDYYDSEDPLYLKVKSVSASVLKFEPDIGDEATIGTFTGIANTQIHGATPIEVSGLNLTCD